MEARIAAIVSGHGEVAAVPVLLRRIAAELDPALQLVMPKPPQRAAEARVVRAGELERLVELAARTVGPGGGVLVLLDCDDDCPAIEGPKLAARARATLRPGVLLTVVLAKREYESWFLAAAQSVQGQRGLTTPLAPPEAPEGIRDAKGWLSQHMVGSRAYSPVRDQAAFTATFDLALARARSDSFDVCYRHVVDLLRAVRAGAG